MKFLGNFIWLLFGGWILALCYFGGAVALAVTIVGIPFAVQLFKIGILCLLPFSTTVTPNEDLGGCIRVVLNIIWFFFGGLAAMLLHCVFGLLLCVTIIGIPWGRQHFRLAGICLSPFGKTIRLAL